MHDIQGMKGRSNESKDKPQQHFDANKVQLLIGDHECSSNKNNLFAFFSLCTQIRVAEIAATVFHSNNDHSLNYT